MTEYLKLAEGTIAYDLEGTGPLVVLAHGMGDSRHAYRFVVPRLVAAGYRVANVDLRGCGDSSVGEWSSFTRTDIAGDLVAIVRHLGGPAVVVGQSISGGAATIAAADAPDEVAAVVEIGSFTRKQSMSFADLRVRRYRQGMLQLALMTMLGSVPWWLRYLDTAYPGIKPADWNEQLDRISSKLREPGRMKVLQSMGRTTPVDADAKLAQVRCPALVIQGTLDPDWGDPKVEGEAIVNAIGHHQARLQLIAGAGHYPHAQFPAETAEAILLFLKEHTRA
ncbi:alpha/beta fold hydrolase [Leifsonia sp. AG29]|uniref:alpha/beta fold hydrolase n=1 Tax=Leifsonia sp. AG29 TaxID=2598860 RepID=UPI00131C0DD5|nr:alpha/beta hydrolase [Leifsonia sp. AG29]